MSRSIPPHSRSGHCNAISVSSPTIERHIACDALACWWICFRLACRWWCQPERGSPINWPNRLANTTSACGMARECAWTCYRPLGRTPLHSGRSERRARLFELAGRFRIVPGAYAAVEVKCLSASGEELQPAPTAVGPGRPDRLSTTLVHLPPGSHVGSARMAKCVRHAATVDFREAEAFFLSPDGDRQTPRVRSGSWPRMPVKFPHAARRSSSSMPTIGRRPSILLRRWNEWHNPDRVVAELLSQRPSIPLPGNNSRRTSTPHAERSAVKEKLAKPQASHHSG